MYRVNIIITLCLYCHVSLSECLHLRLRRSPASVSGHLSCDRLRHGLEAQRLWGREWQVCQEVRMHKKHSQKKTGGKKTDAKKTKQTKLDFVLLYSVPSGSQVSPVAPTNRFRRSSTPPEPSSSPTCCWLALESPASSLTCPFRYTSTHRVETSAL